MKKQTILLAILVIGLTLVAQEIQHDAVAINIEVPVRVFKRTTFIDDLTINDFKIYENGVLQKTEAVYLINKMDIVREETELKKEEARKIFAPEVSRNFVFLFEIHEYLPEIGKAIEYFFNDVYVPGDSLTIVTPLQTYSFEDQALEILTKKEISKELIGQLIKDIRKCQFEYISLIQDLESVETFRKDVKPELDLDDIVRKMHSHISNKLCSLRFVDENKLLEFVDVLKIKKGPKHVFFFLQKLEIPVYKNNPVFDTNDLVKFEDNMAVNETKMKPIFSDTSITLHTIYVSKLSDLNKRERERRGSVTNTNVYDTSQTITPRKLNNISGNIFNTFKELAEATGGIADRSINAATSFKKAVKASEKYYLLYYSPMNFVKDGKYKEIKIRIKGKGYRIMHRAGYVAD